MNILILTHRVPFPQNGGYAVVVCSTIRGLVNLGHSVTLAALNDKNNSHYEFNADDSDLISRINYQVFNIDTTVTVLDVAVNLFSKTSFNIDKYFNEDCEKKLIGILEKEKFDIIQFEGLRITLYLPAVQKHSQAKIIYRAHNLEHIVWGQMARQKNDPFKKSYLKMHAGRIRNFELEQLNRFHGIVVFTEQDKAAMMQYGVKVPVEVMPVGINIDLYHPDYNKTEFPTLFFLGSLDWLPNREGIEWFMENFAKELTDGDLRVKFYLAGNDIPEQFDDYEVLGQIFIQGEVDDALEFVNSKAIMIVPLLSGSGMRVKIVEGMAMQKCIISTSLGAEGIMYTNEKNILIANNQDEFYEAIKLCIADEDFCKTIGINARSLVEEEHGINKVTAGLVKFYEHMSTA